MNLQTNTAQTFAELRKYIGNSNFPTTKVLGKDTINDGFGGIFYYDSTSTSPDDNEFVIQPVSVLSGRWLKLIIDLPPISVPNLQEVTDKGNSTTKSIITTASPNPLGIGSAPNGLNLYNNSLIAGGSGNQGINYYTYGDGIHTFSKRGTIFGGPVANFTDGPVKGLPAENLDEFATFIQAKNVFIGTVQQIRNLGFSYYTSFISTDYGGGQWYLDSNDTTALDNLGTVLRTSIGQVIKRIGLPNALNFGAVPDFNFTTNTGTDNTQQIQNLINYIASIGGGDVFIPSGFYNIVGTVYINKSVSIPINIKGVNKLSKDSGNAPRGTCLIKKNAGDIFRVNLDAGGNPFSNPLTYQLNVGFDGLSFEGSETEEIYAIRAYRVRGNYTNLGGKLLDGLIFQDELRPVGYVGTWDNYCDQSIYMNITMFNMKKYGLYLSAPDRCTVEGISYEYPKASAICAIRMFHGWGFTIKDALCSNPDDSLNGITNSYFIWCNQSGSFTLSGIENERNYFDANIFLDRCKGVVINGVGERFRSKDIIRMQGSRSVNIFGLAAEADKVSGYYDIADNSGFGSTQVIWTNPRLESRPDVLPITTRSILTNFTPDAIKGHIENYERVTSDIAVVNNAKVDKDNWVLATPNYSNTPNYQQVLPALLTLGEITQNTTFAIPSSALHGGKRMVIRNTNTSAFSWTLSGSIILPDLTTTNSFPNGTITEIAANSDSSVATVGWYRVSRNLLPATSTQQGTLILTGEFSGTGSAPTISTIVNSKIRKAFTVVPSTANYTATGINQVYYLPGITSSFTFTLPSSPQDGYWVEIINRNTTVQNWTFTNTVLNNSGATVTLIPNNSYVYIIYGNGQWRAVIYPLSTTATLDFPSVGATSESTPLIITLTGITTTDNITLTAPNTTGIIYKAYISAANTVSVIAVNYTGSPIDPPSGTFIVSKVN